jgi:hypothetical protein
VGTSRWSNSSGRNALHRAHAIDVGPNEQDAQPLLAIALVAQRASAIRTQSQVRYLSSVAAVAVTAGHDRDRSYTFLFAAFFN